MADADLERWASDVVLSDGGTVHVRPISPDDAERLRAFHARLSPQTIYFRFFSPKPRLTDQEVTRFATVDFVDRAALVAMLGDDLIGVARFDRWPGKDEAEVAFVVADDQQGRGLGTVLLEHLAAIARERGIRRFTAEVLPDNRPMLSVFKAAGFDVTTRFSSGIVDVAFDLDPTLRFIESVDRREHRAESRSIERLVRARSVAVIGASDREGSVGRAVFRNLLAGGFDGPVYPVNPTVPHVASVPAFAHIADIPDDVHLAVLAVPAGRVASVVEECAAKRVRGVVVIATGFSDEGRSGEGAERQLVEFARRNGMRLIGPASMGLITTTPTSVMHACFAPCPVTPGRVGLSLQSGPLGIGLLELAHRLGLGLSQFVSLGNKSDVSANDLLNFWDDDPGTDVVLVYTESFGNPRKFARIARRVSRRKPIVAVKPGRDNIDAIATDALYQQAGVIRVDTVRELLDVGRLLVAQPVPSGRRAAIVANAVSPARLALDALTAAGLHGAVLDTATIAALADEVVPQSTLVPTVDLTYRATPEHYRTAVGLILADPGVDAVLTIYAPPTEGRVDDVAVAITTAAAGSSKPVAAVTLGRDDGPLMAGSSIPNFAFPEAAAKALGRAASYGEWRARPVGKVHEPKPLEIERAEAIVAKALTARPEGTLLPLAESIELLGAFGVPIAPMRAVTSLDGALAAADEVGYPVTLKAAGLERLVRSESGGVALDVQDADELRGSYVRMAARLGAAMAEAVVQRMVPGGVETIATVEAHPSFGPVIGFGLGGAFADAIADRPARGVPLTDLEAADLVAASRAAAALAASGIEPSRVEEMLTRLGALVDAVPEISRVRLNPVLVSVDAAWVIDAQVHVAPSKAMGELPVRRL
jgi:acyl-CoA synthetase (NDP forming)/GNAT superfamily N-acetyltransferase